MLKRRTKRKLVTVGLIMMILFVILIAGAEAGRVGKGWRFCDLFYWC